MRSAFRAASAAVLAFVLLLSACSGDAASPVSESDPIVDNAAATRIDSTLRHFVDSGSIAGVAALIFEDGQETYFNAFGMADQEAGVPMARNTIVQIFSMTKPITGVALMTLFEDGAFELDEPLSKYAPEFSDMQVYAGEDANGNPILEPPHREITIRDITRHTAGFATGGGDPGVGPLYREANPTSRNNTLVEMAEKLGSVPLLFHPEERWAYGPSVDVQAFLVESLTGIPFDEYLQQHIFNPLGMPETRYLVPESDLPRFSSLYNRSDDGTLTQLSNDQARTSNTQPWPLKPGGFGLTSTLDDYMRFAQMLVNEGELDGERILEPETVHLMATNHLSEDITERSWLPSKGQVGFGIDFAVRLRPPVTTKENYGVVGEFFWDGAASTLFWVDPENSLTAVLFVQLVPFDRVGLHKAFRDAVYGQPVGTATEP